VNGTTLEPKADLPGNLDADLPDPNGVVPDFEVPAPPTFDSVTPVPGIDEVLAEPVIPEPVLPESAVPTRRARDRQAPDRQAPDHQAPDHPAPDHPAPVASALLFPAAPPAPDANTADADTARTDDAGPVNPYLEPGTAAPNSYRGWTIGIFTGLAVLLIGAILALVYLLNNVPLQLPSSDEKPASASTSSPSAAADAAESDAAESDAAEPATVSEASGTCDVLCADVAAIVGDSVTGADGVATWRLSAPWRTDDDAAAAGSATEATLAEYSSSAGTLTFTVWDFSDDATAEEAFTEISDQYGEPDETGSVYEDGSGTRHEYDADGSRRILWSVTGEGAHPWVMLVEGPQDDSVFQFYLSLPI
jgi:hypothetical protein